MPLSSNGSEKPLIIIDNSLMDQRGHHLALANTLSMAALASGIPVIVYAHKKFVPSLLPCGVEVRLEFSLSVYELFASKQIDVDMGIELRKVLAQIVHEHPMGARVLFHTADAYTYCALADWLPEAAPAMEEALTGDRWDFHVVTPYEPKLMPGFAFKSSILHLSLRKLAKFRRKGIVLSFWSETARLAEFYRQAYSLITTVLELPTPQWAIEKRNKPLLRERKLVMLFLGAAREEKGFLHLPRLAREIALRPWLSDRVIVRIQCSAPIVGFSEAIGSAMTDLQEYDFVEVIDGVLELDEYAHEMLSCDLMLLLYHPSNYFARGSGIVMEALCSGKHILGTKGTFMECLDHGGLAHFGSTGVEWVDIIEALAEKLHQTRSQGARVGSRIAELQSPTRYLNKLLNRERFDIHFTSTASVGIAATAPMLSSSKSYKKL